MVSAKIFKRWGAYLGIVFFTFTCAQLWAGSFTPGNFVVVRVGDGTTSLTNQSNPVFLDEYTPTGTLVQSIELPTAGSGSNHALTLSGKAITEGQISLSTNNRYLVVVGFDTVPGYANVSTGVTNRTIALIDSTGTVNTSTGYYSGSAYVEDNFRSGFTEDGTGFWTAGAGNGTSGGTWYTAFGSFTASPTQLDATIPDTRVVRIFDGQLYFSADNASGNTPGLYTVGNGVPTTASQTVTLLPGFGGVDSLNSPFAFYFFDENPNVPGVDVVYVCDDDVTGPTGGLNKFSLVNGTWVFNGNIPNLNGLRGMTGYKTCTGANLFLTAANAIFSFSDTSGYNQPLTGSLNQIAVNANNTYIRGVALTPGTTAPPPVQATISSTTNVTCYGGNNGLIIAAASEGYKPYTYNWGNGVTSHDRNNLIAGNYSVTVTDAGGCTASASAVISQASQIVATPAVKNATCYNGSNGSVTIAATGGTPPYTFNNNADSILSGLSAGSYTVTVDDHNNCSATVASSVSQGSEITITDSITNLPCQGGGDSGVIRIYVSGGAPSYTYVWSDDSTSATATNLVAGNYSVTVTDSLGCTVTFAATVSQSGNLAISPEITSVLCYGQSNGAITISGSGGTAPYVFIWNNSDTGVAIYGLGAGSYTVTMTDQGNCTLISTYPVTQPDSFSYTQQETNIKCYADTSGSIELDINGGTTPYTYLWSNEDTTENLLHASAGIYTVHVIDLNGCALFITDTLSQPDSIAVSFTVVNDTVYNAADGSVTAAISGGVEPYSFAWNDGTSGPADSNLVAGNYCLTVTDNSGCSISNCVSVTQPAGILPASMISSLYGYTQGDNIIIRADLVSALNFNICLIDLSGRVLYQHAFSTTQFINITLPAYSLASSCYVLRLSTDVQTETRKVTVVK